MKKKLFLAATLAALASAAALAASGPLSAHDVKIAAIDQPNAQEVVHPGLANATTTQTLASKGAGETTTVTKYSPPPSAQEVASGGSTASMTIAIAKRATFGLPPSAYNMTTAVYSPPPSVQEAATGPVEPS